MDNKAKIDVTLHSLKLLARNVEQIANQIELMLALLEEDQDTLQPPYESKAR